MPFIPPIAPSVASLDLRFARRIGGGQEAFQSIPTTNGTINLDCAVASVFRLSNVGGPVTLNPVNVPASGQAVTITVIISQGGTAQSVTVPGGTKWLSSVPTQTANKDCVLTMMTYNGGSWWYCSGAVQA